MSSEADNYALLLSGKVYNSLDVKLHKTQNMITYDFKPRINLILQDFTRSVEERNKSLVSLYKQYLGSFGENSFIMPPFNIDFGCHTYVGKNVFINAGCSLFDTNNIYIEDSVLLAPNVQLYTVSHPLRYCERDSLEDNFRGTFALPIRIGQGSWIGGGSIILPGVTLGKRCVVGAGSVVSKDAEDDSLIVGNPARFVRKIDQSDSLDIAALETELAKAQVSQTGTGSRRVVLEYTLAVQRVKAEAQRGAGVGVAADANTKTGAELNTSVGEAFGGGACASVAAGAGASMGVDGLIEGGGEK